MSPVFADSAVVFNPDNGHYYQRFELANVNWNTAKANCSGLNAHLVTYSGTDWGVDNKEANFVFKNLVQKSPVGTLANNNYTFYYIGAVYNESKYTWSWVTGEAIGVNFPATNANYDYLGIPVVDGTWGLVLQDGTSYKEVGVGIYGYLGVSVGYVCEWDGNNYIASATLPDISGNGYDENALLYLDYKTNNHTVVIRDQKDNKLISTLIFPNKTPTPPIGLAVIADINNNKIPEIAVLSGLSVRIKDAKAKSSDAILKTINFLNSNFQPRSLSATYSANTFGYSELTVVGSTIGNNTTAETRDSKTGTMLYSNKF